MWEYVDLCKKKITSRPALSWGVLPREVSFPPRKREIQTWTGRLVTMAVPVFRPGRPS